VFSCFRDKFFWLRLVRVRINPNVAGLNLTWAGYVPQEKGEIMTAEEWKNRVRECPNAQGFRCSANGSVCRPENCAFIYLSNVLGKIEHEDE